MSILCINTAIYANTVCAGPLPRRFMPPPNAANLGAIGERSPPRHDNACRSRAPLPVARCPQGNGKMGKLRASSIRMRRHSGPRPPRLSAAPPRAIIRRPCHPFMNSIVGVVTGHHESAGQKEKGGGGRKKEKKEKARPKRLCRLLSQLCKPIATPWPYHSPTTTCHRNKQDKSKRV